MLISVYLPTKNRAGLVERAINSVLSQSYRNLELIVVNDGSSDSTSKLLSEFSNSDPRVKILTNSQSIGPAQSRNLAISKALGNFCTGLDDDDYYLPHRLETFIEAWSDDVVGLYTDVVSTSGVRTLRPDTVIFDDLLLSNQVGNQVFARTETFRANPFDTQMLVWEDLECWLNFLSRGGKMKKIGSASMIIDDALDRERITTTRSQYIDRWIEKVSEKYSLDTTAREKLEVQRCSAVPLRRVIYYLMKSFADNKPKKTMGMISTVASRLRCALRIRCYRIKIFTKIITKRQYD